MQTKKDSLFEAFQNIAVGSGIALASQMLIFPLMGINASVADNLILTGYFTIISVGRSYGLRRFNNWKSETGFSFREFVCSPFTHDLEINSNELDLLYQNETFLD